MITGSTEPDKQAPNHVFVVDSELRPLSMCHPARARALLREGKAAVLRRYPFTIIMKESMPVAVVKHATVKLDPGSKTTGIALVGSDDRVLFAAELVHRGLAIKAGLEARRGTRHSRRARKTRYRAARFDNRRRTEGWLPPSLQHRLLTTMTWVQRFRRWAPVTALSVERVKFDMQQMQNPDVAGFEYQQGTLAGYTVREYLLERDGRACIYCGKEHVPLQIEHIVARANGGSSRVSNLVMACESCNRKKGKQHVEVFLQGKPAVLKKVLAQLKKSLTSAAAVNATRNALFRALLTTGVPVETGSGAQTKFNRSRLGLPKSHWIDAACVGDSGATVTLNPDMAPLRITACGHGNRQLCGTDKHGFPIRHRTRQKLYFGFQTGDFACAEVTHGKHAGRHVGRVLVRANGFFDLKTAAGRLGGIAHRYCQLVQRKDGYCYG